MRGVWDRSWSRPSEPAAFVRRKLFAESVAGENSRSEPQRMMETKPPSPSRVTAAKGALEHRYKSNEADKMNCLGSMIR
jgi:hypothetical protein